MGGVLNGRKVLVTGAGGFIGSHLSETLVKLGDSVTALVHYNSAGSWGWLESSTLAPEMEIVSGDISDRDFMAGLLKGVEVVFHLAALIAIPYSYRAPFSFIRTNIEGSANLFALALHNDCLVVHTSTSEVYGTARYTPMDEEHPLQAQSPYAASKIAADKMAESFHCSYGLPVVTVRPFNTYGPRQSMRAIIPTIIVQALTRGEIHLGNTAPQRDFNYVLDTVDGFIKAAATPAAIGQVTNIGSGQNVSIGHLADLINELIGSDCPVVCDEERQRPQTSEVDRLLASNEKAGRLMGWTPTTSLNSGLGLTIDWFREHLQHFKSSRYSI